MSNAPAMQQMAPMSDAVAPFEGVIGVEGMLTGDGRLIEEASLEWAQFPLPLRWAAADFGGHDGAVIVGRIDRVERRDNGDVYAWGVIDLGSKDGQEVARLMRGKFLSGVSMDLDSVDAFEAEVTFAEGEAEFSTDALVTQKARVRAATLVAIPAFDTARLSLIASATAGWRMGLGHGAFSLAFSSAAAERAAFSKGIRQVWKRKRDRDRKLAALAVATQKWAPRNRELQAMRAKVETLTGRKVDAFALGDNWRFQWRAPRLARNLMGKRIGGQFIDMPGLAGRKIADAFERTGDAEGGVKIRSGAAKIDEALDRGDLFSAQDSAAELVDLIEEIRPTEYNNIGNLPSVDDDQLIDDGIAALEAFGLTQTIPGRGEDDQSVIDTGDAEGANFDEPLPEGGIVSIDGVEPMNPLPEDGIVSIDGVEPAPSRPLEEAEAAADAEYERAQARRATAIDTPAETIQEGDKLVDSLGSFVDVVAVNVQSNGTIEIRTRREGDPEAGTGGIYREPGETVKRLPEGPNATPQLDSALEDTSPRDEDGISLREELQGWMNDPAYEDEQPVDPLIIEDLMNAADRGRVEEVARILEQLDLDGYADDIRERFGDSFSEDDDLPQALGTIYTPDEIDLIPSDGLPGGAVIRSPEDVSIRAVRAPSGEEAFEIQLGTNAYTFDDNSIQELVDLLEFAEGRSTASLQIGRNLETLSDAGRRELLRKLGDNFGINGLPSGDIQISDVDLDAPGGDREPWSAFELDGVINGTDVTVREYLAAGGQYERGDSLPTPEEVDSIMRAAEEMDADQLSLPGWIEMEPEAGGGRVLRGPVGETIQQAGDGTWTSPDVFPTTWYDTPEEAAAAAEAATRATDEATRAAEARERAAGAMEALEAAARRTRERAIADGIIDDESARTRQVSSSQQPLTGDLFDVTGGDLLARFNELMRNGSTAEERQEANALRDELDARGIPYQNNEAEIDASMETPAFGQPLPAGGRFVNTDMASDVEFETLSNSQGTFVIARSEDGEMSYGPMRSIEDGDAQALIDELGIGELGDGEAFEFDDADEPALLVREGGRYYFGTMPPTFPEGDGSEGPGDGTPSPDGGLTPEQEQAARANDTEPAPVEQDFSTLRANWDPAANDGLQFDDVYFDAEKIRADLLANSPWAQRAVEEGDTSPIDQYIEDRRTSWEARARTEPAKSYEKGVPIRLLPVGSEVYVKWLARDGRNPYKRVGKPVNNGDIDGTGVDDIVGKYQDGYGQWDYVSADTTFDLGHVPREKKTDNLFRAANERAALIQEARRRAAEGPGEAPEGGDGGSDGPSGPAGGDGPLAGMTDAALLRELRGLLMRGGSEARIAALQAEAARRGLSVNGSQGLRARTTESFAARLAQKRSLVASMSGKQDEDCGCDEASAQGVQSFASAAARPVVRKRPSGQFAAKAASAISALRAAKASLSMRDVLAVRRYAAAVDEALAARDWNAASRKIIRFHENVTPLFQAVLATTGTSAFSASAHAFADLEAAAEKIVAHVDNRRAAAFGADKRGRVRDLYVGRRKNWVEKTGGLPKYIRRIADHLIKRGMTEGHAIASAVNTVKRWARGGSAAKGQRGNVNPDTVAKAVAALAEWEAKKAASKAFSGATTSFSTAADARKPHADNPISNELDSLSAGILSVSNAVRRAVAATSRTQSVALVASAGAKVKSIAPIAPPTAWFADPKLDGPTPLTVTPEGRVYGHLATWDVCHLELAQRQNGGKCVTAPKSKSNYSLFHLGYVTTAEGKDIPTGRLVAGTPHADPVWNLNSTLVHYSDTGQVAADVRAGEDRYGIWVAGALRPDATPEQVRVLKASPLSGDWRTDPRSGRLELVAALAVNSPGYAIPRPQALIASNGAVAAMRGVGLVPPSTVIRPGTPGAFSADDLKYLKERALATKSWAAEAAKLQEAVAASRAQSAERVKGFSARRTVEALASKVKEMR